MSEGRRLVVRKWPAGWSAANGVRCAHVLVVSVAQEKKREKVRALLVFVVLQGKCLLPSKRAGFATFRTALSTEIGSRHTYKKRSRSKTIDWAPQKRVIILSEILYHTHAIQSPNRRQNEMCSSFKVLHARSCSCRQVSHIDVIIFPNYAINTHSFFEFYSFYEQPFVGEKTKFYMSCNTVYVTLPPGSEHRARSTEAPTQKST